MPGPSSKHSSININNNLTFKSITIETDYPIGSTGVLVGRLSDEFINMGDKISIYRDPPENSSEHSTFPAITQFIKTGKWIATLFTMGDKLLRIEFTHADVVSLDTLQFNKIYLSEVNTNIVIDMNPSDTDKKLLCEQPLYINSGHRIDVVYSKINETSAKPSLLAISDIYNSYTVTFYTADDEINQFIIKINPTMV